MGYITESENNLLSQCTGNGWRVHERYERSFFAGFPQRNGRNTTYVCPLSILMGTTNCILYIIERLWHVIEERSASGAIICPSRLSFISDEMAGEKIVQVGAGASHSIALSG